MLIKSIAVGPAGGPLGPAGHYRVLLVLMGAGPLGPAAGLWSCMILMGAGPLSPARRWSWLFLRLPTCPLRPQLPTKKQSQFNIPPEKLCMQSQILCPGPLQHGTMQAIFAIAEFIPWLPYDIHEYMLVMSSLSSLPLKFDTDCFKRCISGTIHSLPDGSQPVALAH